MMPHQCHRFPWRRHTIHTDDDYDDGLDDDLMMRAIKMEKNNDNDDDDDARPSVLDSHRGATLFMRWSDRAATEVSKTPQ